MIVTRKDAEGNLKDQKYKNASGEPMNQKDAYTIVHLGGIDGPNSPTPNDKFIANEGTSGEYSNSLNITNQKSKEVVAT